MLAVWVNGEFVKRGTYDKAPVPDGADVKVIHAIAGGVHTGSVYAERPAHADPSSYLLTSPRACCSPWRS